MTEVLDVAEAKDWTDRFIASFGEHRDALTDLDRQSGDGDFGPNMQVALDRVVAGLDGATIDDVGGVFTELSASFMRNGGTSGPLYGMWFRELAKVGTGVAEIDLAALARAVSVGVATVQRFGHAEVGDCTMVDAMVPAATALVAAVEQGADLGTGLKAAAAAARAGAESTAEMVANRGRASYVGEVARGVLDPGAVTVALFFESAPALGAASKEG